MKYSTKKIFALITLIVAALCASSAMARRTRPQPLPDEHVTLRSKAAPDSFDAVIRNGEVVGMTGVMKDGRRIAFTTQSKPTCATSCPAGQRLICWENEAEMMSMCVCGSGGGGGGGLTLENVFVSN
jgi:hypothetical protein